ncbi:hypothetical protein MLD38_038115 [Melastoma candidum]|uniref:Uncharacterized protein n=2 Tax=Melastoma candidum TaxID=119954 RepID=A0ACB9KZD5_9MYRT|nr:hypothetical protein MLD38_038115 [Melastoma candidum]
MPRYDDRRSSTRLYVGHLSSRTRTRDLEDLFARYGRVRAVDMKRDYAFVEYGDPRDADDARYGLDGREFKGSRIVVEFSKGAPRGSGGSRDFLGRGPPPGSGRCFNCGIDGHWARDCKAGDWKNKCYHCGDRGHIERNCPNSPKKLSREQRYSRSPSPRHGRSRSRSFSRSHSYSRSPSPVKRERERGYEAEKERGYEDVETRPRSPHDSRSPTKRGRSPSPRGRRDSPGPDESSSPRGRPDGSPENQKWANGLDYGNSPRGRSRSHSRSRSPGDDADGNYRSPVKENGHDHSPSPIPRDEDGHRGDDDDNGGSPRGSGTYAVSRRQRLRPASPMSLSLSLGRCLAEIVGRRLSNRLYKSKFVGYVSNRGIVADVIG